MGIRFLCPNGHKLNVKTFLAGKRAICPDCGARVVVPTMPDQPVEHMSAPVPSRTAVNRADSDWMDSTTPSVVLALSPSEMAPASGDAEVLTPANALLPDSIIAATTAHHAPATIETKAEDVA